MFLSHFKLENRTYFHPKHRHCNLKPSLISYDRKILPLSRLKPPVEDKTSRRNRDLRFRKSKWSIVFFFSDWDLNSKRQLQKLKTLTCESRLHFANAKAKLTYFLNLKTTQCDQICSKKLELKKKFEVSFMTFLVQFYFMN